MTGRYPIHTGMQHGVIMGGEPWGLSLDEKIMPQYLTDLGYVSHIVGKWHLGTHKWSYTPTERGFFSHYGYQYGASEYYKHVYTDSKIKGEGLDFFDSKNLVWNETGHYSTELYTARAKEIILSHNKEQPLFLYMPFQAVHSAIGGPPLEAPQKYVDRFNHIKNKQRRLFAAMVSAMDDAFGSIVSTLEERDMLADSIIVFTTDNGGPAAGFNQNMASNQPLRGVKHTLWEGGTRGTSFIWSPLLKNYGYISEHLMHCTDWLPTLMAAVNHTFNLTQNIDGINMWPTLDGKNSESPRKEVLLNIDPNQEYTPSALRQGQMKILRGVRNEWNNWYPTPTTANQFKLKKNANTKSGSKHDINKQLHLTFKPLNERDYYEDEPEPLDEDLLKDVSRNHKWNWTLSVSQEYIRKSEKIKTTLKNIGRVVNHFNDQGPLIIQCGQKPINASNNCDAIKKPCLFNVVKDPCEYHNIADAHPEIVERLLDRIDYFKKRMVTPRNRKFDPKSDPKFHNGAWVPWIHDVSQHIDQL